MNVHILRGLAAVGALSAGVASAAVDTAATTAIASAATDIATVGGAVFLVMVGIKLVKWIRRAL
jgi:Inovirus Coat protein B